MFNEEMRITADNQFTLYIKIALKNIDFALISIDYILNTQHINQNIYKDRHTFYFYYLQNLLAACGNISNIFNNNIGYISRGGRISPLERSKELREYCGLILREFPLIFKKEARNTNMHFDERYDECNMRIGDYNIIDENTPYEERWTILNTPHLRTYNKQEQVYITVGRYGERIEFSLEQLHQELIRLSNLLNLALRK